MLNDIAFLVYEPYRKKRKNNSFDGNDNRGAKVIKEILETAGFDVAFCAPETAHKYRTVLVSLTSTYDIYAFYSAVAGRSDWQRGTRAFKVICGGFGMQNPITIRNIVDYAVFGRAEDIIIQLTTAVLDGNVFEHESVMSLPDITPVKIAQAKKLYQTDVYTEQSIGCVKKCLFCHYSWCRRPKIKNNTYTLGTPIGKSPEVLFSDLNKLEKFGRIRTALDGFSERLRLAYGKKITNQDLIEGINYVGEKSLKSVIMLYNIGNFPGETKADRLELVEVFKKIRPAQRVIVILHTTPFRASLATPMQFAPVGLYPSYSNLRLQEMITLDNLLFKHSMQNESPLSQLKTTIVERATEGTDKLFRVLCFSKKLKSLSSDKAIMALRKSFDLTPYLREYEFDDRPAWFLESYVTSDKMYALYHKAKAKLP